MESKLEEYLGYVFSYYSIPEEFIGNRKFLSPDVCEVSIGEGQDKKTLEISLVGVDIEVVEIGKEIIQKPFMIASNYKKVFAGSKQDFEKWIIEMFIYTY